MPKINKRTLAKRTREIIADAGGPSTIAEALTITPWAVRKWRLQGRLPLGRVVEVVRLANREQRFIKWHIEEFIG